MTDNEKTKALNELRSEIIAKIEAFNVALKENNFTGMSKAENELKEAEGNYAETKAKIIFEALADAGNPIMGAIKMYEYPVLSHKNVREDGKVTGIELIENRMKQIDLIKLSKYCRIDCDWQWSVEKFNQLLCLRAARELKLGKSQINDICKSFYMNSLARKINLGETPDSNTSICKQLQTIVDAIIFEDNGKGGNNFKINNHDIAYLLMCYTKKGKKALSVATAKHGYVHKLVMDICHRVVTGKQYDLEYKVLKDEVSKK